MEEGGLCGCDGWLEGVGCVCVCVVVGCRWRVSGLCVCGWLAGWRVCGWRLESVWVEGVRVEAGECVSVEAGECVGEGCVN